MNYLLAVLPILVVIALMVFLRLGGHWAGPAGWAVCVLVALTAFGLDGEVFWVSQAKALLLSLNILVVLWAALYVYHLVNQIGGVEAIAMRLERLIADRGLLLLVLAWVFSAIFEGVAGLGVPIAIVSPMLAALGIPPLTAVAATAIGHSWAVTFGNMGVVFQTLVSVTGLDPQALAPYCVILMGVTCLTSGLGVIVILKRYRLWPVVVLLAVCMTAIQYLMATIGLPGLGSFSAALVGIAISILLGRRRKDEPPLKEKKVEFAATLFIYGLAVAVIVLIAVLPPVNRFLSRLELAHVFPEVVTGSGFVAPAGPGQVLHPLTHPGVLIFLTALVSYAILRRRHYCPPGTWKQAAAATFRSAGTASIGVISMIGLSTLMDHCGMNMLLAQGLSQTVGAVFPLFSPLVGMLGAFATGSNSNSNVLFAPLQQKVAVLLKVNQVVLASAQTAGGSIGSMIAPAKLVVGCSTNKVKGLEGKALRYTLPVGLLIGLLVGVVTLLLARL